jgi:hypothetical protein
LKCRKFRLPSVSEHLEVKKSNEVMKQGAEEDIWIEERRDDRRMEKTA